jgi:hypothetical protein
MVRWGIRTAFVSVPAHEWTTKQTLPAHARAALAQLRSAVGTVFVAGGDPSWSRSDAAGRAGLPRGLERLLDIARRAGPVDGIALDVEPQVLPAWRDGRRAELARGYLSLLERAKAEVGELGGRLCVAVHPSHAATPDPDSPGRSMFSSSLRHVDHVVTMAYRRDSGQALRLAAPLLGELARSSVAWHFGVTAQHGADEASISFAGAGREAFRRQMTELVATLRDLPAGQRFRGIAVHHYAVARALLS